MIKIGIIGTGYWGKHHLRIFSQLPCEIVGISDIDPAKEILAKEYKIKFFTDFKKLLAKVDAVSIVTPPATHFHIARKALKKGKHVLLEKPFVFKKNEAEELKKITKTNSLILMSGHTYLYHPAIIRIRELMQKNEIGKIYYLFLNWFNLGIIRHDVNALWNFAPHPFSILHYLFGTLPVRITANGKAFIQKDIEDVVFINLQYANGITAQINMSWLHPVKRREVTVVGSKKLVHFDDVDVSAPLKIYDKGVSPEEFNQYLNWETYAEFQTKSRYGNMEIPKLSGGEPLMAELGDFINSIGKKGVPQSDIDSAVATVTLLEKAQKSLMKKGASIEIGK